MLKLIDVAEIFREKDNFWTESVMSGVSIDSRTLKRGELFVALKGKKYDGHNFLEEAFEKGAVAAIVQKNKVKSSAYKLIEVNDTQDALCKVASIFREKFRGRVIAVTGSNGKTTTKDIIAHILNRRFKVLKTEGTQNNKIGVPLTMFNLRPEHNVIVCELGASAAGEIEFLKEITRPDMGVITNIGESHLEFLKTKKGVLSAKLELFSQSSHATKAGFLNFSDEFLREAASSLKGEVISFGLCKDCRYRAENIYLEGNNIKFTVNGKYKVKLNTIAKYNVYNALAAWGVADYLGMPPEEIQESLSSFIFPAKRLELTRVKDLFLIDDSYNANPASVSAALKTIVSLKTTGKKIVCLGDMYELGQRAEDLHYAIGREAGKLKIDTLITFGKFAKFVIRGAKKNGMKNCILAGNKEDAVRRLLENVKPQASILFKASRGVKMEEVIKCFINSYTN